MAAQEEPHLAAGCSRADAVSGPGSADEWLGLRAGHCQHPALSLMQSSQPPPADLSALGSSGASPASAAERLGMLLSEGSQVSKSLHACSRSDLGSVA